MACLLILLVPTAFVVRQAGPRLQAQQYADLLTHVQSHAPLYLDHLSAPDPDWLIQEPTASDGSRFAFEDGHYIIDPHFAGSDTHFPEAYAPGVVGAVAVEVTVRLQSDSDTFGAGLVLHGNGDRSNAVLFLLRPHGTWSVFHFGVPDAPGRPAYLISSQSWGAIRTGVNVPNTLAVVVQADRYILHINHTLVGIFNDPAPNLLGQVGIVAASKATFTDFAAYPA